jgi:hypothetical protein
MAAKLNLPVQEAVEARKVVRCQSPTFCRRSTHRWRSGCQPYAPAALYTKEDPWYSFPPEAESTQGHRAAGRIKSTEKSNDGTGNRPRDLPVCSIVPQPTMLPRGPV